MQELVSTSLPREAVKRLFLACLFLGDYLPLNDQTPIHFLSQFQTEIKTCAKNLLTIPDYNSLYTRALSQNKRNPLSTTVS